MMLFILPSSSVTYDMAPKAVFENADTSLIHFSLPAGSAAGIVTISSGLQTKGSGPASSFTSPFAYIAIETKYLPGMTEMPPPPHLPRPVPVSYTHLRAHETGRNLVC